MVDRFQSGEIPVFVLSLKAAGTGLNLTRAGHVVHFDRWWNPAVEEQATDRAYRIGQTQPVQVHRLIAEGTVEDRIAEMLDAKRALADAVLGSGEARPDRADRPGTGRSRLAAEAVMTGPRGPRHDDRRRTFPALPPRPVRRRGDFAATWWGNAWVDSMEDTALDPARLRRGRAYADRGHVDAITVTPGRVMAYVHGSRPRPYRTEIRLRTLDDDDWEELLDTAAARPDHIAALLDKDMPHALAASGGPAARRAATSPPTAPARTTVTPASTRRRSATRRPGCSTRTRSSCS